MSVKLSTILLLLLNSQIFAMDSGSYVFNPITNRQCAKNSISNNAIQHDTVSKTHTDMIHKTYIQDTNQDRFFMKQIPFPTSPFQEDFVKIENKSSIKCPFPKMPAGLTSQASFSNILPPSDDDSLDNNIHTARAVSEKDNILLQDFMDSFEADEEDNLSSSSENDSVDEDGQPSTLFGMKWQKNKQRRNAVTDVNIAIQKLKEVKQRHIAQMEENRKNKLDKIKKINKSLMKKKYFPELVQSKSKD